MNRRRDAQGGDPMPGAYIGTVGLWGEFAKYLAELEQAIEEQCGDDIEKLIRFLKPYFRHYGTSAKGRAPLFYTEQTSECLRLLGEVKRRSRGGRFSSALISLEAINEVVESAARKAGIYLRE